MAGYEIGARFLGREDKSIVATVTEKTMFGDMPHYKLSISPNLYNVPPRWLSEYGILIDFIAQPPPRTTAKKKRRGLQRFFS